MEQLSMVKGGKKYWSLFGSMPLELEKQKIKSAYYEWMKDGYPDVAVPYLLGNRQNAKAGTELFKKRLEEVGVR